MCVICYEELRDKVELEKHMEDCHTFVCDVCRHITISVDSMENHILDKHARPDVNGEFKCDECEFKTKIKNNFGKHFKEVHGSKVRQDEVQNQIQVDMGIRSIQEECDDLKEENRALKNNFERLQMLYHEAQEEISKVKGEYEARIITANDDNEKLKAENEILQEKVDVLFKLGRSYINNSKQKETRDAIEGKNGNCDKEKEEVIEVIPIEEENENIDDLQAWSVNKMRGFKRGNPTTQASKNSPNKPSQTRKTDPKNQNRTKEAPILTSLETDEMAPPRHESVNDPSQLGLRRRYCHYFVNQGKCLYEERTGLKCKFEHKVAPMCNSGIKCTRQKCMFSHPKLATTNSFLGRNYPIMNPGPNIWQMMSPWVQTPNQFPPSPWISQLHKRSQ